MGNQGYDALREDKMAVSWRGNNVGRRNDDANSNDYEHANGNGSESLVVFVRGHSNF